MIKVAVARTPILAFILTFFALGYTVAHNKVVVIPLGADAGVSGYELVTNSTSINPTEDTAGSISVSCPDGKRVLGGGGGTGTNRHIIRNSQPNGNGWLVLATRKGGAASGASTLAAFVICANTIG